ncbi:hypothetical protein ZWY2020_045652 [Hordeum vulgare]|nr:hypothetical protein ZWY2020_045652 [Hordeum vulgare]
MEQKARRAEHVQRNPRGPARGANAAANTPRTWSSPTPSSGASTPGAAVAVRWGSPPCAPRGELENGEHRQSSRQQPGVAVVQIALLRYANPDGHPLYGACAAASAASFRRPSRSPTAKPLATASTGSPRRLSCGSRTRGAPRGRSWRRRAERRQQTPLGHAAIDGRRSPDGDPVAP